MKLRQTLQDHQDSEPMSASDSGTVLSSRAYPDVQATVDNSPRVIAQSKTLHSVIGNEQPAAPVPESIAQETSSIANTRSAPIQFMLPRIRSLTYQVSKSIAGYINNINSNNINNNNINNNNINNNTINNSTNNNSINNILNNKPNKRSGFNKKSLKKINRKQNTQHTKFTSNTNQEQRRNFASSTNNKLSDKSKENSSKTDSTPISNEENKDAFTIEKIIAPSTNQTIEAAVQDNAIVPLNKIHLYARGLLHDQKDKLRDLQSKKQKDRKSFDKDPENGKNLEKLKKNQHNFERSKDMSSKLKSIGLDDTPEHNNMLVEHFLKAGQQANTENQGVTISILEGPNGSLKVKSTWKILPDNRAYLATMIFFPTDSQSKDKP